MNENRTVIEADDLKPCYVCGKPTKYVDYCFEERLCSKKCDDKFVDMVSHHTVSLITSKRRYNAMERLTESNPTWIDDELWFTAREPDDEEIDAVYRKLKTYEDAEEQGLLVRPPCKVGDKVYFINRAFDSEICPAIVTKIEINLFTPEHPLWLRIEYTSKRLGTHEYHATLDSMLNKTVFLTRESAEAALKEANRND